MYKQLKIGVIGLGEQMKDNLLPCVLLNDNVIIDGICDIDQKKTDSTSNKYKIAAYTSFRQMIIEHDLDCIMVAAPPQVHEEVIQLCFEKGIPVFVEKPPFTSFDHMKNLLSNQVYKSLLVELVLILAMQTPY